MGALEVLPSALVTASAAVRCFVLDMEPAVVGGGPLLAAVTERFDARWSAAMHALSTDAETTARALREAAIDYGQLERLLVPR